LVGYWSFDEATGTTVYDASNNGNDGTLNGNPQWTTGKVAGALQFDGVDDYVEATDIDLPSSFTLEAWVNYNSPSTNDYPRILDKSNNFAFFIYKSNLEPFLQWHNGVSNQNCSSNLLVADGGWSHVVAVYDSGANKNYIYVDGRLGGSCDTTGSPTTNDNNVIIGNRAGNDKQFDGTKCGFTIGR
jgi:hypothetical protein